MTHDNQLGHFFKGFLGIGTKKPFHIVLVDIKEAAKKRVIHCVEKPLDESNGEDLNYVALSYRWGEWQETLIDTEVGYTASITSFDLHDFYNLCDAMACDPDLCSIQYVWVDAICVDQVNHERRKATIYQMSNIYEHAAYILAVPDLHSTYLRNAMLKNEDIMNCSRHYSEYLYHLIHGNYENLAAIDESFLDDCGTPKDTSLRELLTKKTGHFAEAFIKCDYVRDEKTQLDKVLNQICAATDQAPCSSTNNLNSDGSNPSSNVQTQIKYTTKQGRHILTFSKTIENSEREAVWKELVSERSNRIRQSMEYLADLIRDWSTRVWVISEFSIARKKNNLKFWFIQIKTNDYTVPWTATDLAPSFRMSFFNYDFERPISRHAGRFLLWMDHHREYYDPHSAYGLFHSTLIQQLSQRTFLDMMLKSKASKNEDRFYAVLPQSEYKNALLTSKHQVGQWNISTMASVKLKLYEIMNTRDKLNLLFWSCNYNSSNVGLILPTFATSTLALDASTDYFTTDPYNFDMDNPSTIMLHQTSTDGKKKTSEVGSFQYYIHLKPLEYYTLGSGIYHSIGPDRDAASSSSAVNVDWDKIPLYRRHQIMEPNAHMGPETQLNIVAIHSFKKSAFYLGETPDDCFIFLIGNAVKNKWILDNSQYIFNQDIPDPWVKHHIDDYSTGFNIY